MQHPHLRAEIFLDRFDLATEPSIKRIDLTREPSIERINLAREPSIERVDLAREPLIERLALTREPLIQRIDLRVGGRKLNVHLLAYLRNFQRQGVNAGGQFVESGHALFEPFYPRIKRLRLHPRSNQTRESGSVP